MIFTVNCFPRSGTNFLKKALAIASNQDTTEYMDLMKTNHEVELFYEKDRKVITILRDPKEAIVSTVARGYYDRQHEYQELGTLDSVVSWWFQINKAVEENINDIYPILFEDFSSDLQGCLLNIGRSFEVELALEGIFEKTKAGLVFGKHHDMQVSSKNSPFYDRVSSDFDLIDRSVIDKVYAYYGTLRVLVLKRQIDLGWK
jgi:hypothetical protein